MIHPTFGRRRFLTLSVPGVAIGVAGCLGSSNGFEYPPGFSEDGVESHALGYGSPMMDLDSIKGDYRHLRMEDDVERVTESTFEVNRVDQRYRRMLTHPWNEEIEQVYSYFADEVLYERIRYADGRDEYRRHENPGSIRDINLQFRDLANLSVAAHWAQGVTFELAEINETVQPKQAIYHANTQGMEGSPPIQRQVEQDGSFVEGEMSFMIDEDGMLHSFWVLAEFEQVTWGSEIEYQDFNDVTVTEPDWVDEARDVA